MFLLENLIPYSSQTLLPIITEEDSANDRAPRLKALECLGQRDKKGRMLIDWKGKMQFDAKTEKKQKNHFFLCQKKKVPSMEYFLTISTDAL